MAKASCSVCGGGIDTESSPSGKCVRCSERAARKSPLAVTAPKAAPPAELPWSAATETHDIPGVGTLHTTRTADGTTYAGIKAAPEPPAAEVGAVPAVEHETPKHEHKPAHHGKKHGG